MYCRASIETSAPCRLSRMRTSGLPPAIRVSVRASSSKIWIRSSAFFSSAGRGDAGVAADRRAQLADLGELREERDQVGREVREVGALAEEAPESRDRKVVLDQLAEALVGEGPVLLDEASVQDADLPDRAPGSSAPRAGASCRSPARPRRRRTGSRRRWRRSAAAAARRTPSRGRRRRRVDGPLDDAARRRGRPTCGTRRSRGSTGGAGEPRRPGPPSGGACRVLLEAAQEDVLELLADLGAERARRLRDLVDDPVEDGLHLAREGRLADEALVEHDAERVDVGAAVEGPRSDLLGREVRDRAHERARSS